MKNIINWAKAHKVWSTVIILVALFVLVGATGSSKDSQQKTKDNQTQQASTENKPKAPANTQPQTDLAKSVDTDLKKQLGVSTYQSQDATPFQYLNGFTNTGNGNVDVSNQNDCTKSEAKSLSKQIMGMVGSDIKGLDSVTVKCTNGSVDFTLRGEVVKN